MLFLEGSRHRREEREGEVVKNRRPMTVGRLYRTLQRLMNDGHDRTHVCVRKDTFVHPLESDGAVILDAYDVRVSHIEVINDDGGFKTTKAGRAVIKTCAILTGWESNPDGLVDAGNSHRPRRTDYVKRTRRTNMADIGRSPQEQAAIAQVLRLGHEFGFGNLMHCLDREWAKMLKDKWGIGDGEHHWLETNPTHPNPEGA